MISGESSLLGQFSFVAQLNARIGNMLTCPGGSLHLTERQGGQGVLQTTEAASAGDGGHSQGVQGGRTLGNYSTTPGLSRSGLGPPWTMVWWLATTRPGRSSRRGKGWRKSWQVGWRERGWVCTESTCRWSRRRGSPPGGVSKKTGISEIDRIPQMERLPRTEFATCFGKFRRLAVA